MLRPQILNEKLIFICECGNSDQEKIDNFAKLVLKRDSRGYEKAVRVNARLCSVCRSSVTIEEVVRILKEEEAEKNRQKTETPVQ